LPAGAVEVLPAVALLDDGLEVFQPGDAVLDRVLDDGPDEPRGDVAGPQDAVAEVGGQGEALVDDRDRLAGAHRPARLLDLRLAVGGLPVAELAEDGHDAADLLQAGRLGWQLQGAAQRLDAQPDDLNLLVG